MASTYRGRVTGWPILAVTLLAAFQQGRIDRVSFDWSALEVLVIAGSSVAAFAAVTLIAAAATRGRPIGAVATLAIWAAASAARVAVLITAPALLGLDAGRPIEQIPGLFAITFLVAVATSMVTETQSAHARSLAELRRRQQILAERTHRDAHDLAAARSHVHDAIEQHTRPVRDACQQILDLPDSPDAAGDILRQQVAMVIRPTSQGLLREDIEPPPPEISGLDALASRPSFAERAGQFARLASSPAALRPLWPILGVAIITVVVLGNVPGVEVLWSVYLIGLFITIAAVMAVTALWRWRLRPKPEARFAVLGVLLAYTVMGLLALAVLQLLNATTELDIPITLYLLIIVVSGLAGSAYQGWRTLQRQAELDTSAAIAAIAGLDARLRREVWFERRRLASVLHGRVQTQLMAAAAHLSQDAAQPTEVDVVTRHISEALEALDTLRESTEGVIVDPVAALDELAAVWSPTMRVNIDLANADLTRLSPSTMAALLDIVTEGVLNARKHGEAESVDVVITMESNVVTVVIADDGSGVQPHAVAGLGWSFLEAMSTDWSVDSGHPGARLTVTLDAGSAAILT